MNMMLQKATVLSFCDQGQLFQTFAALTEASTNHHGCAKQVSPLSPTTTPTMADKLIISVTQHQRCFTVQTVSPTS